MSERRKKKPPVQVPEVTSTTTGNRKDPNSFSTQSKPVSVSVPSFYDREPFNREQALVKFGILEKSGEKRSENDVDQAKWYSLQYPEIQTSENDASVIQKAERYASKLIQLESDLYHEARAKRKPGDTKWMKTVVAGGTLTDQVAALTMMAQESPVHNLNYLRLLVNKVTKHSRREALTAGESLKELFVKELLPDRKLVPLKLRPLTEVEALSSGNKDTRDRRILLWYYEDQMKCIYDTFVRNVEKWCHDTVDATRLKATKLLLNLLITRPEQEQFLLASLVNKLGDKAGKVASKVGYYLLQLVEEHPNMKEVVANAVDKLIYRPNISPKAQHYAVCFLSQITLKRSESRLATKLLTIYFGLFKLMVKKGDRGEVDNKMLAVLLKGTNRAFPCCAKNDTRYDDILSELDTLYKVAAVGNFNTSVQVLLLLHQTLQTSSGLTDRFYSAVYRKFTDPTLLQASGQKHYSLFFHLLYQVLGRDSSDKRVLAFVKRLLQSALCNSASFAVAALMLLSNLFSRRPSLRRLEKREQKLSNEAGAFDDDDDDDEHFTDVHGPDSDVEGAVEFDEKDEDEGKGRKAAATWVHRENVDARLRTFKSTYDPWNRNPAYAAADTTLLYELHLLASHYHPTVALFARNLLQGQPIEYPGDPLEDFTLIRFLDRFVYRNPKKLKQHKDSAKDGEEIKARSAVPMKKRKTYNPWGVKAVAVTSDDYVRKHEDEIPVDEHYLHKFMTTVGTPDTKRGKKLGTREEDESDIESVASDEFEQLLTKFEPGAKNEEFDIDFTKDMTLGGSKKKRKRKASEDSDDDSDDDDDLFAVDPDDDEEDS